MGIRAQFWSFDLIFAVVIFSVGLTVLGFTWYSVSSQLALSYGSGSSVFQLRSDSFTQSVLSQGSPSTWYSIVNTTNTLTWRNITIGISASQNSTALSAAKIDALESMASYNYTATKQPLDAPYEYFIVITSSTYYSNGINITVGENPIGKKAVTVNVETRSGVLNGVPVTVTVELWTNQPVATS